MQVKLRVLRGSSSGKEVQIPVSRFFIGRGDDCHLRPKSDAISRHHCALMVEESQVSVRDFNSKNGTYVNGKRISGACELQSGDVLRVGPLEFAVLFEQGEPAVKQPEVEKAREVAARTAENRAADDDISDWLEEADAETSRKVAEPETRQYRLDETEQVTLAGEATEDTVKVSKQNESPEESPPEDPEVGKKRKKEKKVPGKLPPRPATTATDSREAAANMLKKFFNRR